MNERKPKRAGAYIVKAAESRSRLPEDISSLREALRSEFSKAIAEEKRARKAEARVAELEAELKATILEKVEETTQAWTKVSELEAEVEKLRRNLFACTRMRANAEAKLAEARHQLSLEEQQHKDENDRLRAKLAASLEETS